MMMNLSHFRFEFNNAQVHIQLEISPDKNELTKQIRIVAKM